MTGRLDRYVTRRYLGTYLVTATFFLGIFLLMNVFGMLKKIVEASERLDTAGLLKALAGLIGCEIPFLFVQVAPFLTVLAAVVLVLRLRRANELTPMIVAGRSAHRILLPVFVVTLLVVVLQVVVQESVLPGLTGLHRRSKRTIEGREASRIDKMPHLLDGRGTTYLSEEYDPDARVLYGVRAIRYEDWERAWRLFAERVVWREGAEGRGWYVEEGRLEELVEVHAGPPVAAIPFAPDQKLRTDLRPEEIELLIRSDQGLGISSAHLGQLIERFPSRVDLRLRLHARRAFAAANVVLLLLGLPFAVGGPGRSTLVGAGVCILLCAGYFVVDTLTRDAAVRGVLHPLVAAWSPVVLFLGVGAVVFDGMRT
jgi:lipopolysaccharide export system permease protein